MVETSYGIARGDLTDLVDYPRETLKIEFKSR